MDGQLWLLPSRNGLVDTASVQVQHLGMMLKPLLDKIIAAFRDSNPGIPAEKFDQILQEVEKRVHNEPPPRIALIGDTGVGKSSTINALFNAGQATSNIEACTQTEAAIEIHCQGGSIIVYDMPGLNESIATQERHLDTYRRVLAEVDVALWILDAQYRAVGAVQTAILTDIARIDSTLPQRIVFALNKVDLVEPGQSAWHPHANIPSEEQERNIQGRIHDVGQKMKEAIPGWDGTVMGYSAQRRYNLPQLFVTMLEAVSKKRRWVLSSRRAIADFLELVDPAYLPDDVRQKVAQRNLGTLKHQSETKTNGASLNRDAVLSFLKNLPPDQLADLAPELAGILNNSTK